MTQADPTRDALRRWARSARVVCELLAEREEREEAEAVERGIWLLVRRARRHAG